jgi:hypothetical protein
MKGEIEKKDSMVKKIDIDSSALKNNLEKQ